MLKINMETNKFHTNAKYVIIDIYLQQIGKHQVKLVLVLIQMESQSNYILQKKMLNKEEILFKKREVLN